MKYIIILAWLDWVGSLSSGSLLPVLNPSSLAWHPVCFTIWPNAPFYPFLLSGMSYPFTAHPKDTYCSYWPTCVDCIHPAVSSLCAFPLPSVECLSHMACPWWAIKYPPNCNLNATSPGRAIQGWVDFFWLSQWHSMYHSLTASFTLHYKYCFMFLSPPPFTPQLCSLHPGGGVRQGRLDVSLTGMKEREKALCLTGDTDCDVRDGSSLSIWHLCGDLCLGRRRLGAGGRMSIPRERIFYWIPEMGRSLHIRERERRPGWPEFSKKMV